MTKISEKHMEKKTKLNTTEKKKVEKKLVKFH